MCVILFYYGLSHARTDGAVGPGVQGLPAHHPRRVRGRRQPQGGSPGGAAAHRRCAGEPLRPHLRGPGPGPAGRQRRCRDHDDRGRDGHDYWEIHNYEQSFATRLEIVGPPTAFARRAPASATTARAASTTPASICEYIYTNKLKINLETGLLPYKPNIPYVLVVHHLDSFVTFEFVPVDKSSEVSPPPIETEPSSSTLEQLTKENQELKKQLEGKNAIIMEQIKVIQNLASMIRNVIFEPILNYFEI